MPDSTINGLTALTGANVDNTADQFAIWDNSDSTTKKITRTELLTGIPEGTAAAPAISLGAGVNAGIYATGSSLSFLVGGSQRMIWGTASFQCSYGGSTAIPAFCRTTDQNTGLYFPAADTLGLVTGGSEALRIDSSGRVGIGTASPSTFGGTLNVVGPSSTSHLVLSSSDTGGAADLGGTLTFAGNDGATEGRAYAFISGRKENATSGNYASYLSFATRVNGGSTTERMRIGSNGAVGIGITNPQIWDANSLVVAAADGSQGQVAVIQTGGTGTADIGPRINFFGFNGTSTNTYGELRVRKENATSGNNASYLSFCTVASGASSVTERMRITSAGNVLVNTAAIATTATDGFLYVPTCAGTPTGTPTTYTGRSPIVVDSTNNKLYFYSGGAWRDAGP